VKQTLIATLGREEAGVLPKEQCAVLCQFILETECCEVPDCDTSSHNATGTEGIATVQRSFESRMRPFLRIGRALTRKRYEFYYKFSTLLEASLLNLIRIRFRS
jgi:hypothetical protein